MTAIENTTGTQYQELQEQLVDRKTERLGAVERAQVAIEEYVFPWALEPEKIAALDPLEVTAHILQPAPDLTPLPARNLVKGKVTNDIKREQKFEIGWTEMNLQNENQEIASASKIKFVAAMYEKRGIELSGERRSAAERIQFRRIFGGFAMTNIPTDMYIDLHNLQGQGFEGIIEGNQHVQSLLEVDTYRKIANIVPASELLPTEILPEAMQDAEVVMVKEIPFVSQDYSPEQLYWERVETEVLLRQAITHEMGEKIGKELQTTLEAQGKLEAFSRRMGQQELMILPTPTVQIAMHDFANRLIDGFRQEFAFAELGLTENNLETKLFKTVYLEVQQQILTAHSRLVMSDLPQMDFEKAMLEEIRQVAHDIRASTIQPMMLLHIWTHKPMEQIHEEVIQQTITDEDIYGKDKRAVAFSSDIPGVRFITDKGTPTFPVGYHLKYNRGFEEFTILHPTVARPTETFTHANFAEGGMGFLYVARWTKSAEHKHIGKMVAIKELFSTTVDEHDLVPFLGPPQSLEDFFNRLVGQVSLQYKGPHIQYDFAGIANELLDYFTKKDQQGHIKINPITQQRDYFSPVGKLIENEIMQKFGPYYDKNRNRFLRFQPKDIPLQGIHAGDIVPYSARFITVLRSTLTDIPSKEIDATFDSRTNQKIKSITVANWVADLNERKNTFKQEPNAGNRVVGEKNIVGAELLIEHTPPGAQSESMYLVMRYIRGNSLENEVNNFANRRDAIDFIAEACKPVAILHSKGIVHRDLNYGNIYRAGSQIDREIANPGEPIILDLGAGTIAGRDHGTYAMGVPGFVPPEQYANVTTTASDQYSLAANLYLLLTKVDIDDMPKMQYDVRSRQHLTSAWLSNPQFNNISLQLDSTSQRARQEMIRTMHTVGLPQPLIACILKAMHQDPRLRYNSVTEFGDALKELIRQNQV
ncbi:MAG TPA: hypothetical protein VLG12_02045 [Candidatus Saccharimonadales bacterium]|nr:hypothetical protein [Candidatus Saccharimonadales bacterium]